MGEASAFKSGKAFDAYVGLVPKQTGSGGKARLLGITASDQRSYRGDGKKLAQTVWAIAVHDRKYDKNHVSIRPY